jgi:hypothetical protein
MTLARLMGIAKPMPTLPPLGIEQGSTAVAGINGRIRLDHIFEISAFLALDFAVQRTHDARGQSSREAERIADRQHLLPHLQAVGIAEFEKGGELLLGLDLNQRQIVGWVAMQNLCLVAALIRRHGHLHVGASADDVKVGENLPVGVNQEARSQSLYGLHAEEKIPLIHGAGDVHHAFFRGLVDVDVVGFIGAETGGVSHGRSGPCGAPIRPEIAHRRILAARKDHKCAHQRQRD